MGNNIKMYAVIGAGYGDEGKGLITDYFCGLSNENKKDKVLNIKVNGGAQAGHTVCRINSIETGYKHNVFRQYGSGTFTGADTLLLDTFMLNIDELLKEKLLLEEIYFNNTKLLISKGCQVTLPIHVYINRFIENTRTKKHGSCGLGIYETFHMNNDFKQFTVDNLLEIYKTKDDQRFVEYFNELSLAYLELREQELKKNEGIILSKKDKDSVLNDVNTENNRLLQSLTDLIKMDNIIFMESLQEAIEKFNYTRLVFEHSQGLELDQFDTRNFPHLTPSSTGVMNIVKELNRNNLTQGANIEICFVTRSYKTKHGAGLFLEQDDSIMTQFGLYDRTNQPNQYQGILKYGRLNIGRLKRLIFKQQDYLENNLDKMNKNNVKYSLAITHLDQTNGLVLESNGNGKYTNYTASKLNIGTETYVSFGEKATDVSRL